MYQSFFNLDRKPFELLPNPDFMFLGSSHRRALIFLEHGIRERAGFILLTGEVGSGKTTVLRSLLRLHDEKIVVSRVFNTLVDADQLLAMINDDFGLDTRGKDKTALLRDLNLFLIEQYGRGNFPVLIIDEAQNLSPTVLEEVRMLSNLETDDAKLLQIVLAGQPELRDILAAPEMRQLRQRISVNCHLKPFDRQGTEAYIIHRLEVAGNRDAVLFSQEVFDIIHRFSRGIPRLVNIICDFLMLAAFAEETREIDRGMVEDVIGDLDFEAHYWGASAAKIEPEGEELEARVATLEALLREILEAVKRDDLPAAPEEGQENATRTPSNVSPIRR